MTLQPMCSKCNRNPRRKQYKLKKDGSTAYMKYCNYCHTTTYNLRGPHTKYKGDLCEFCGFIPVDRCQLDVDHKDGNHSNNDPSNLQTLCANCHRLKTKRNRDCWKKVARND